MKIETEINQVILSDWMVHELNLKDSELLVFAVIDNATFYAQGYNQSIKKMTKLIGYSPSHIYKTIRRLKDRNLITKIGKTYYSKIRTK